jgi:hypothetical protein
VAAAVVQGGLVDGRGGAAPGAVGGGPGLLAVAAEAEQEVAAGAGGQVEVGGGRY